ncbi:hypothetical protein N9755_01385 [bacterium]|nr:hypothetical protein [bacterium]
MLRLYLHNHDPHNRTKDFSMPDIEFVCANAKKYQIQLDFDDAWRIDENIFAMLRSSSVEMQINVVTSFSQFKIFPHGYFSNNISEVDPRKHFFSFDDLARLQKVYSIKIAFHSYQHQRACENSYRKLIDDYSYFKELCDFYKIEYENEIVLPYGRPPAVTDWFSYKRLPVRLIGTEVNYRYWLQRSLFNMSTRVHVSNLCKS